MRKFATCLLLLVVGTFAWAQFIPRHVARTVASIQPALSLSKVQLGTLKTWLTTNAAGKNDEEAAALLNATASPDFWVWRTLVTESELYETTTGDGTTWSWTTYIARSQAERDSWRQMVSMRGGLKPSLLNVRNGVADVFSGAGGANQRTHLLTVSRRKVTVGEKLYATGTGSTASPADFGVGADGKSIEGLVTIANVSEARNEP